MLGACSFAPAPAATDPAEPFLGRWTLTLPNGSAGWLEITRHDGWYAGNLLWGGGSVLPVASVTIEDDLLTVTRLRDVERRDADGAVVLTQKFADTITARVVAGDRLSLTVVSARTDGTGFDRDNFTGRRALPLPPRPDLTQVKFGDPVRLFNGRDLSGWSMVEPAANNTWQVEHGVLVNHFSPAVPDRPHSRSGNLRTEEAFEDFNLTLEVNIPAGSNSGIYLRGIYEIQVEDSRGRPLDSHNMGAVYSRIAPVVAAEKPAGEWQSFDLTLVDRHVTVVLNGVRIIDNRPLAGCTGGALWSDEARPGPIYLQGDHGPVSYRNIVLRPVIGRLEK